MRARFERNSSPHLTASVHVSTAPSLESESVNQTGSKSRKL